TLTDFSHGKISGVEKINKRADEKNKSKIELIDISSDDDDGDDGDDGGDDSGGKKKIHQKKTETYGKKRGCESKDTHQ
ncbi:hypothetical protein PV326_001983, partial [Microctonus aethiopoides]